MKKKRPNDSLLSRLARPFSALGRLVGGQRAENAEQSAPQSTESDFNIVEDSFTLALEAMLNESTDRFQTKLHIISLVEFREAVGAKWSRLSEKVMMIAEGVINLHLGAGNVYGRQGQDFFILLFRNTPAAEERRRAVLIAQELGTRLVGAQFIGAERPLALAAEISLADALWPDGSIDMDAIEGAVGEVRSIIEQTQERPGYRPHLTKLPEYDDRPIQHSSLPAPIPEQQDLRAHLRPSKLSTKDFVQRRSMLPSAAASSSDNSPKQVAAPSWVAVEMSGAGKTGGEHDPSQGSPPLMPGDAALSLAWRPSWVAEGEVIGAYKAHVQRVDSPGETPWEGCRAYPPGGGDSGLALDRYTVGAAVREMRSAETSRSGAVIIIPIHWCSATSPQRMSVLAPFADLSEEMRTNRLIIDLFGIPDGTAESQLMATVQALRPMCREVSLRVRLAHPRTTHAAQYGIKLLGVDLGELSPPERTDDDTLMAALTALYQDAKSAGLGVYAWGIRRRTVVLGCVSTGFAMINGPGLMKDLPRPAKVLPAPRSRFAGPSK